MCFYEDIDGPTNVVTDQVTEDTAVVSWDPVQAVIDKYVVRYTSADGETKDTAVPREQNSTVLRGLKPGEAYRVYVWAERGRQESRKANTGALTGTGRGSARGRERLVSTQGTFAHLATALFFVSVGEGLAKAISSFLILNFPLSNLKQKRRMGLFI